MNVIATGAVFILLAPTTKIFSSKFPEQKDTLWLYPAGVVAVSSILWFLVSLSMPVLIRCGVMRDLRRRSRTHEIHWLEQIINKIFPVAVLVFHSAVLIFVCISLIALMRSDALENIFKNLP